MKATRNRTIFFPKSHGNKKDNSEEKNGRLRFKISWHFKEDDKKRKLAEQAYKYKHDRKANVKEMELCYRLEHEQILVYVLTKSCLQEWKKKDQEFKV